ncbi:MAG: ABC transporter permease [Actinobacteria bacterium]|nr:ABC transporter permease [Actinomycetota bacterium]
MTTTKTYDSAAPRRPIVDPFVNIWRNRSLIWLLVGRDLTLRYKRSVLGVWWTVLNPLLTTLVYWFVFSAIFERDAGGAPFIVYLLSGTLLISSFFSQGSIAGGSSLISSRSILSKIRVPGESFAVTAALAAGVNFAIGLVILAALQVATGWGIPWTVILVPIPALAMLCLVTGFGMLIASAAIHFYDVLDLVRVILQLAIWLVPTFYPIDIVPDSLQLIIKINPLYSYLVVFRGFMYEGVIAPSWNFAYMGASALVMLLAGVWVFSRSWRNAAVRL